MEDKTIPSPSGRSPSDTPVDLDEYGRRLCNWNRWGKDDQLGTVNYITPRKVVEACGLVRTGKVFELCIPLDRNGPHIGEHPRRFNAQHYMTILLEEGPQDGRSSAEDVLFLPLHGGTHWDALAHTAFRGKVYGGHGVGIVKGFTGAEVNSICAFSGRIITKGVLLDVARCKGVDALDPGYPIGVADLEACVQRQQIRIDEGDILLIRTGFLEQRRRNKWIGFGLSAPGLSAWTLEWLHERRVAGVAADNAAVEVKPSDIPGYPLPFHSVAQPYMGLLLGEAFELEKLAEDCAADGRYDFLFTAPALPITGGLGSPTNPYAVK